MGELKVIKSISDCPIHHQFRPQDGAGSTAHGTGQDFLVQERGNKKSV